MRCLLFKEMEQQQQQQEEDEFPYTNFPLPQHVLYQISNT